MTCLVGKERKTRLLKAGGGSSIKQATATSGRPLIITATKHNDKD